MMQRYLWDLFLVVASVAPSAVVQAQGGHIRSGAAHTDESLRMIDPYSLMSVDDDRIASATPLFWHIPKAGGTTIHDWTSHCLGLVVASEVGVSRGHARDARLKVFAVDDGAQFVNIDATTVDGMKRANRMMFPTQGTELAEVVFTGFMPHATHLLFDAEHKASLFALFRHPVDRAISLFYYLKDATWEPTYHPEWASMSLLEFLRRGDKVEHDWMVRNLVGVYHRKLNQTDLELAKDILRTKVWVGLIVEMEESLMRFGGVYRWSERKEWAQCMLNFAHHGSNMHLHPELDPKSEEWQILKEANYWDLQLYAYAVQLFQMQKQFFQEVESDDDVINKLDEPDEGQTLKAESEFVTPDARAS